MKLGKKTGELEQWKELTPDIFTRQEYEHNNKSPYFTMRTYSQHDLVFKDLTDAFEGIHITLNTLEWPDQMPELSDLKLIGDHRVPFHFVKILDNEKDVLILSQDEFIQEKEKLMWGHENVLYHLTLGFYGKMQEISDELLEKIVKIKFLNGESCYTKKELTFLRGWMLKYGAEPLIELYEKQILVGYPEKAIAFANSNLHTLFQELASKARAF